MTKVDTRPAPLPPPTMPSSHGRNGADTDEETAPRPDQRWARSDDRVILGVAGGLGRALAIDPLVVRLCFVALALFSGVGVLLYLAAVALLADSPSSPPTSPTRRIIGGALALIALAGLFGGSASLPGAGWVVALGLAGIAMALWRGGGTTDASAAPTADEAVVAPKPDDSGNADASGDISRGSWMALPAQPRPPRSNLGMVTIGAAAMAAAIAWMANSGTESRGTVTLSVATIVLGAGLLIGAFFGRARWLIVPAAVVGTAAVAASAIAFAGVGISLSTVDWGVHLVPGDRVSPTYETGRGSFELWLTDYDSNVATTIEVGIGDLTVFVPDNARVQVDARVGAGEIRVMQSTASGYRRTLRTDSGTGAQLINLTLRVGIGRIEVVRASAAGITVAKPSAPGVGDGLAPRGNPVRSYEDGTVLFADGSIQFDDGQIVEANRATLIPIAEQLEDGSIVLANGAIIKYEGTVITPGGFIVTAGTP